MIEEPVLKTTINQQQDTITELLLTKGWAEFIDGQLQLTKANTVGCSIDTIIREVATFGYFPTQSWFRQYVETGTAASTPDRWFEARAYRIRPADLAAMPDLLRLEAECWIEPLRATAAELQRRLEIHPLGNYLLEMDNQIVGVIYSQRITDSTALFQTNFRDVAALHTPAGPIAQPLAVNVLPAMQQYGFGDQLLEFLLQLATLQPDIERVAAVTLCKQYPQHDEVPLAEYIHLRNEHGQFIDPILNFHASHGAQIRCLVPNYRPADTDNRGNGVFIEYDLRQRLAPKANQEQTSHRQVDPALIPTMVEDTIRSVMGEERAAAFARKRPLMEMGFGSFQLLELRTLLSHRLGVELDPTFFFRYGTPEAMIDYFQAGKLVAVSKALRPSKPSYTLAMAQSGAELPGGPVAKDAISAHSPIAIIGMACRFPGGVTHPAAFWSLLVNGEDAITEVPADRWAIDAYYGEEPGQIRTRYGGFLDDVAGFDAPFFRIAPVEATTMDPQQRLLLETHWEALEHAGINPETLHGSATGIYVGIFADDYKLLQTKHTTELSTYFGTGTANSIAAGRIAYFLGSQGPAMAVDTACSSSLVAVHLACQSLKSGESSLALASGVNLLLSPELSVSFSQANMLAPDGRCKTFDAAADGYVRSEGCGVVVLKRLVDAQRDGDPVLAVIRGTAINQDGASNGLTAPNGLAQEAVIRRALAAAQVAPETIAYVETHGTGTPLGDPIEVQALTAVYGVNRQQALPLILGSVKTNIGHTEAAAGIAGLLKVVLALQHNYIPPHLHFQTINPHLAASSITIPRDGQVWSPTEPAQPAGALPRRAAVSSFGFSGTNAHVIVEEAPLTASRQKRLWRPHHLLTLSAQKEDALQTVAAHYLTALPTFADDALPDIACTTNRVVDHHDQRLAMVVATREEASAKLADYSTGQQATVIYTGNRVEAPTPAKIAFLFTGQGSQYLHMGRELYETQPLFRQRLTECDLVLQACLGRSLLELLYPATDPTHNDLMESHPCGQAANFAIECALADLWRSWGVEPDVVLGHSLGDFAAAYTAGVLSLADGLRLVTERGRLMAYAQGSMVAILATEADVIPFLADYADVTIGVINGPTSVVISGGRHSVAQVTAQLQAAGFKTRKLDIPVAAHSPLLDPVLDAFTAAVRQVTLAQPRCTVISSMTGKLVTDELTDPRYWRNHLRNTVRFADGVQSAAAQGCTVLIEIGPQDTLLKLAEGVLGEQRIMRLPSLQPGSGDWQRLLTSVAQLYTLGIDPDWAELNRGYAFAQAPLSPVTDAQPTDDQPWQLLTLSARSQPALGAVVQRYHDLLTGNATIPLDALCAAAYHDRAHFAHRVAIAAPSVAQMATRLQAYGAGTPSTGVVHGQFPDAQAAPSIAFLFTGQGAQYAGMGRELYITQPVFRRAIDQCARLLRTALPCPLQHILYPTETAEQALIDQTAYTQPALFALEYALAQLWRAWGVEPTILIGHSVGEYVAACLAGVFSLADGLKLIAARGRLMGALPQDGEMVSLLADEAHVQQAIAAYYKPLSTGSLLPTAAPTEAQPIAVSIAAINGAESVVISGERAAVLAIAEQLATEGVKTRRLTVSHAFHSPLMEPMLAEFREVAESITYHKPTLPLVANVTGKLAGEEIATAGYWVTHVREAVRFADGVMTLYEQGVNIFIEVGPKPILLGMVEQSSTTRSYLPSLREGHSDWQQMLTSLGELYVRGIRLDWTGFDKGAPRRNLTLPTYPFQHQRYWIDTQKHADHHRPDAVKRNGWHPLLGEQLDTPLNVTLFQAQVAPNSPVYLQDHEVYEQIVLPGAAYVEIALAAGKEHFGTERVTLRDVAVQQALILSATTAQTIQTIITPEQEQALSLQIYRRDQHCTTKAEAWPVHVSATLTHETGEAPPAPLCITQLCEQLSTQRPVVDHYRQCAEEAIHYGPAFQAIQQLWVGNHEALGQICLPASLALEAKPYLLHPVVLDACFQVVYNIIEAGAYLPIGFDRVDLFQAASPTVWCYVQRQDTQAATSGNDLYTVDLTLANPDGQVIALFTGMSFKRAERAAVLRMLHRSRPELGYDLRWVAKAMAKKEAPTYNGLSKNGAVHTNGNGTVHTNGNGAVHLHPTAPASWAIGAAPSWLIFADQQAIGRQIGAQLASHNQGCIFVYPGTHYQQIDEQAFCVNPAAAADFQQLFATLAQKAIPLAAIVHLWSLDLVMTERWQPTSFTNARLLTCESLLHLCHALTGDAVPSAEGKKASHPALWLVTRNAQAVAGETDAVNPLPALLWGMGRTVALEHPELWGGLIDLDSTSPAATAARLVVDEIKQSDGEDQVVWRNGQRYVPRLTQAESLTLPPITVKADGLYLITGGLGTLGRQTVRWLVERGARHLVIVGRSGRPVSSANSRSGATIDGESEQRLALLRELAQRKIAVEHVALDISDAAQVAELFQRLKTYARPLRGIIHAAGTIAYQTLSALDAATVDHVLRPKVLGAWHLHQQSQEMDLDFFVLFSSAAAIWGATRLAHYGAANHFMDALAYYRQNQGLPALSINWARFAERGMMTTEEESRLAQLGLAPMSLDDALAGLGQLLMTPTVTKVMAAVDWSSFLAIYEARQPRPLFANIRQELEKRQRRTPAAAVTAMEKGQTKAHQVDRQALQAMSPEEAEAMVTNQLSTIVATVGGFSSAQIDKQRPLLALGLDSLMAMQVRNRVTQTFEVAIPVSLFMQGSTTIMSLATYLLDKMPKAAPIQAAPTTTRSALKLQNGNHQRVAAPTYQPEQKQEAYQKLEIEL